MPLIPLRILPDQKGLAFQKGYRLVEARGAALIWMSAGNSYFTEEVVHDLIAFAAARFSKIVVMAPDGPAESTYAGIGYEGNDVIKKARLNANLLQNRARRAVGALPEALRQNVQIVEWKEEIVPNAVFQHAYRDMIQFYRRNESFRRDSLEAVQHVIQGKLKPEVNMKHAAEKAVHYLLQELAFVNVFPKIYGVDSVAYVYHKHWPIYEKWVNGDYDQQPKNSLGFVIVE